MKKGLPILLGFVIVLTVTVVLVSSDEKGGPRITITEPNFNFGFAPEGSYMAHEYILKNTGDERLEIKRVRTTCGCASAPVKKMSLDPDEETTVTVIFNSTRYFHKTSKAAIISTNDPTRPSEKVTFIADMDTVKPRVITPEPKKINLGKGENMNRTGTALIRNISEQAITVQVIDYYSECLEEPELASIDISDVQASEASTHKVSFAVDIPIGEKAEVSFKVKEEIPTGEIVRASFTIAAMDKNGKEVTRVTIPVSGGGK